MEIFLFLQQLRDIQKKKTFSLYSFSASISIKNLLAKKVPTISVIKKVQPDEVIIFFVDKNLSLPLFYPNKMLN
jgi:hypothetical protein